jgi:hypothetical protein
MKPKDQAREWLDQRCGRHVHVETRFVNSAATPLVNAGPLSKQRKTALEVADAQDSSAPFLDLYQVGTISYNLGDLPDGIEIHIRTEPADQLEMTFDDGASLLIKAMITVIPEEEGGN